MASEEPPHYTRYRARRRLLGGASRDAATAPRESVRADRPAEPLPGVPGEARRPPAPDAGEIRSGGAGRGAGGLARRGPGGGGWRRWARPKRIVLGLLALIVGWLLLSLLLFLISSHFNRTPLEANVASWRALEKAGPGPLRDALRLKLEALGEG